MTDHGFYNLKAHFEREAAQVGPGAAHTVELLACEADAAEVETDPMDSFWAEAARLRLNDECLLCGPGNGVGYGDRVMFHEGGPEYVVCSSSSADRIEYVWYDGAGERHFAHADRDAVYAHRH